jgi:hypothetical protein
MDGPYAEATRRERSSDLTRLPAVYQVRLSAANAPVLDGIQVAPYIHPHG